MHTRQGNSFGCRHTNYQSTPDSSHTHIEENQDLGTGDPGTRQRITIKGTCQRLSDYPSGCYLWFHSLLVTG